MENTHKEDLFVKQFGKKPTNSKADQFFLDYLEGKEKRDRERRTFKEATISQVVHHYTKSA
jgi:hypothetical protein